MIVGIVNEDGDKRDKVTDLRSLCCRECVPVCDCIRNPRLDIDNGGTANILTVITAGN